MIVAHLGGFPALDLHLDLLDARGAWYAERALGAWTKSHPDSFFGLAHNVVRTQVPGPVPDPDPEGWLGAGVPEGLALRYPAVRRIEAVPRDADPATSVIRMDEILTGWPDQLFDGFALAYAKLEQVLERRSLPLPPIDR